MKIKVINEDRLKKIFSENVFYISDDEQLIKDAIKLGHTVWDLNGGYKVIWRLK